MGATTDDIVRRLYRALVEELLRREHPEDRPLKVSELYEDIVPYRAVRSTLGVELNADYEDALLRLLAGEHGLLRLEPEEARAELRREVEAPYPSVGMFRKFSASDVWVTFPDELPPAGREPDRVSAPGPEPGMAPDGQPPGESSEPVPGGEVPGDEGVGDEGAGDEGAGDEATASPPRREPGPRDPARADRAGSCLECGEPIPAGRGVRYCPHCGSERTLRSCRRCGARLEPEWRYCVGCGFEVGAD